MKSIQLREEHWVIADLTGKPGDVRTVPIPGWLKSVVDAWTASAQIADGRVFRSINKAGKIGDGMTPKMVWKIDKAAADRAGIQTDLCPALPPRGR